MRFIAARPGFPSPIEIMMGIKTIHEKLHIEENINQPKDYVELLVHLHHRIWIEIFK